MSWDLFNGHEFGFYKIIEGFWYIRMMNINEKYFSIFISHIMELIILFNS